MRSLIQKVLSESIIIYIKNSNHNTNLKEIKKGYCEKCRTNKKKGHNKMTKQEQQNGIVHASYSELQLEELETITAARVAMTAARAAHGCPEDGHWEIRDRCAGCPRLPRRWTLGNPDRTTSTITQQRAHAGRTTAGRKTQNKRGNTQTIFNTQTLP